MCTQVTVFSNLNKRLLPCLRSLLPNVTFHDVQPDTKDPAKILREAEIIIGDYVLLEPYVNQLPKLKWLQGTYAGVETIIKAIDKQNPPSFIFTRFTGQFFGTQMAEYVVTMIAYRERGFQDHHENQKKKIWGKDKFFYEQGGINGQTIGIMGFGTIGKQIAKILKIFEAKICALVRTIPNSDDKLPYVDKYWLSSELPEFLANCDYVINVLPSIPETTGILDNGVLKNCASKKTVLINIGRSNIVSEKCLIEALEKSWLGGAILDVFDQEPLPENNPLWNMPQVTITPHISGITQPQPLAEAFVENYHRYHANEPLINIVDINKGY